jgi:hypothetical protein
MPFALLLPIIALAGTSASGLTIDNVAPGAVVRYPVLALRGTAIEGSVAVGDETAVQAKFPVSEGKWAGFVQLKPGENMVKAQSGQTSLKILVDYKPMTNPYKVITMYVLASDSQERYYTSHLGDKFPIREKMDIMMKLLQSATAEMMNVDGYGRKTFALETDSSGTVQVHFLRLPKTAAEMRAMDNGESWNYIYGQAKAQFPEETTHWAGLLGFTAYDRAAAKASGTYALGGGSLALFGSGTLQWMPSSWADVPTAMEDATVIETPTIMEDSAGRQTIWANVSTGYGALLHELGHTFGLPHSADGFSVMSRGFDHFNRWFTVFDPVSHKSQGKVSFSRDQMMKWDPFFAFELNASPYFQPDGPSGKSQSDGKITVTVVDAVLVDGDGIIGWAAMRDDLPHYYKLLPDASNQVKLSIKDLREQLKTDKEFSIVFVDKFGAQTVLVQK